MGKELRRVRSIISRVETRAAAATAAVAAAGEITLVPLLIGGSSKGRKRDLVVGRTE